jgi:hypothetical protein
MTMRLPRVLETGVLLAALGFASLAAAAPDRSLKVVIVRHGEKPDNGDNLSCQGQNRALQLPAVLFSKFGKPDFTYVPALKLAKGTSHARMFQTVSPMAIKHDLTVNSKFEVDNVAGVAGDVMKQVGTVLMVWEHSQIPPLAAQLGVSQALKWPGKDFDSIWIVTYPAGKAVITLDKEGLTPSPSCQF